jgi:predicted phage baseplate assembly protein
MNAIGSIPPQQCRTELRRAAVRAQRLGGIDSVEPSDDGRTLTVTFVGKAPVGIGRRNVRVDGGQRITGIRVLSVVMDREDDPQLDDCMLVTVDRAGDSSTYTLCVVEAGPHGRPGTRPYPGFDPRYACAAFTFLVACPADLDCAAAPPCPTVITPGPVIDYTAKDYDAFLQLLLDRMTLTVPDWVERHVPDLEVTLAEVLAYVADQLSYQQDSVATEAYLDTARKRASVRRHVRLVDYAMHDGCNARAFVTLAVSRDVTLLARQYRFVAVDVSYLPPQDQPQLGTVMSDDQLEHLPPGITHEVFEPLTGGDVTLVPAHNQISFWTWGDEDCCLPAGATAATLSDAWAAPRDAAAGPDASTGGDQPRVLGLRPGDMLIIEEVTGPRTGAPADADPTHRQAVRLTSVTPAVDQLYDQPVLEVTWGAQDALTFQACLSAHGGPDCQLITDVTVARGNVLIVDHGRSITFCGFAPETIPIPPAEVIVPPCRPPVSGCPDRSDESPVVALIHALLSAARAGQPVTADEIAQLGALTGAAAIARADLTADAPVPQQAAEMEALLAQLTYPPVPTRFRPVLSYAPVTQVTPYPDPALVSAEQAAIVAGIPGRVRARMEELWRAVHDGHDLTAGETAELAVVFTQSVLDEVRLAQDAEHALDELLARFSELLAIKLARLATLAARAASGAELAAGTVWEIQHTWGDRYASGLDPADPVLAGPAAITLVQDPRAALPAAEATAYVLAHPGATAAGGRQAGTWRPRRDLLAAGPQDRFFVGEARDDGRLALRFGDGTHGLPPPPGDVLKVSYRVGSGTAGNVGPEAIDHLVLCGSAELAGVDAVRNPLGAAGGTDPEPVSDVRQLAPLAPHRTQLRAITADDYATLAAQLMGVSRAAADIRWTGSGEEVHVAIEPVGGEVPSDALVASVTHALEPYRRIGHGLVVGPVDLVPLDVQLSVCVDPGYQRGHVLAALLAAFGTGTLPSGTPEFFSPAVLGFGDPVRVSQMVAVATAIPGVLSAQVTRLRRLFGPDGGELAAGLLRLGPRQIAQCDSDPNRPDNGRISFVLGGGR